MSAYFYAQAVGYAKGADVSAPGNFRTAVTYGSFHLRNFLRPWSEPAWPLAPILCGVLVFYAPFLPDQIADGGAAHLDVGYVALVLGAGALPVGGELLGPIARRRYVRGTTPGTRLLGRLVYLVEIAASSAVAALLLAWIDPDFSAWPRHHVDAMTFVIIGWLLFASYVGSQFDGWLDAEQGVVVQPDEEDGARR